MPKARKTKSKRKPIIIESKGRTGRIYECDGGRFYRAHLRYEGRVHNANRATKEAAREFILGKFGEWDAGAAKPTRAKMPKIKATYRDGTKIVKIEMEYEKGREGKAVKALLKNLPEGGEIEMGDTPREKFEIDDTVVFSDFDPNFTGE